MYRAFSIMLGESFREAVEAFRKNGALLSNGDESFRQGYLMGLHRVYTLMEQAADVNEVPLKEISLDGLSEEDFVE